MKNKPEYTRFLPHYHPVGAAFFVTYRLNGSLPQVFLDNLVEWYATEKTRVVHEVPTREQDKALYMLQREYFIKFDDALDKCLFGPSFLKNPRLANMAIKELTRFDGQWYHLLAYTVMPNHVHVLLDFSIQHEYAGTPAYKNLDYVIGRVKGASSRFINLALGKTGESCWQAEYHDRYIRNQRHRLAAVDYIKQNVVSAGIVQHWQEHPFTWVREDIW